MTTREEVAALLHGAALKAEEAVGGMGAEGPATEDEAALLSAFSDIQRARRKLAALTRKAVQS